MCIFLKCISKLHQCYLEQAYYLFELLGHINIYVFMNYIRKQHKYISTTFELYISTYI